MFCLSLFFGAYKGGGSPLAGHVYSHYFPPHNAAGIGGPPMMVMYAYLDVSKAAVRGTNSIMSLVQVSGMTTTWTNLVLLSCCLA